MEFVSEEADRTARVMESKLVSLPPEAGVLFASAKAVPTDSGGGSEFHVCIGIARRFSEETGRGLIRKVLEAEILAGLRLRVAVHRGVSGACRDDGTTTIGPS